MSRLEQAGIAPAPSADRATLLRRASFDLIGLPPTPGELNAFLNDTGPDAYERLVNRLLASPHYGERWAQHWLDVVRYAETNGYEADEPRLHAWRYRDYVVRAFNDDMPFDRFMTEQLAGDEVAGRQDPTACADLLIAAGFHRCGPIHLTSGNTDPEVNRQEVLTEMTTGVAAAFLGLTIGCARCHDHKFDPISQADYYRMQSFFAAAQPKDVAIATDADRKSYAQQVAGLDQQIGPLQKKVSEMETPHKARLSAAKKSQLEAKYREALAIDPAKRTGEQKRLAEQAETLIKVTWDEIVDALSPAERVQRAAWRRQIHDLESQKPLPPAQAWSIADEKNIPATYLLLRGDPRRKGAEVAPAMPRVLCQPSEQALPAARLDRIALSRWLSSPRHPLTARVLVNRLWQHHFGRGLVATPNDFGLRGQRPSHPELLDWLATEFVSHGWSIKHMHRLMVLSNTYQQTSRVPADARTRIVDPDNLLFGRMNRVRLDAESLRDAALAAAGTLNRRVGGPMVLVPLEPEVYAQIFTEGEPDGLWRVTPDTREHQRRSLYLFAKRNVRLPLMEAFDRPDTVSSCPVRPVSTFAPQALILLNGPFLQDQSVAFAKRLLHECDADSRVQIERAFLLALARSPQPDELSLALGFLNEQRLLILERLRLRRPVQLVDGVPEDSDPAAAVALRDFCLALLNRNEFVYRN